MATVQSLEEIRLMDESRARFSRHVRATVEKEAKSDEQKPASETELWESIRGFIININLRYTKSTNPMILFEWDVHDLWHQVWLSASVTPADDAGQDRLVAQVLFAREMGILSRTTTGTLEECVTNDGFKIWIDLPYLVSDFRQFWDEQWIEMNSVRRFNVIATMARLTALGVCNSALSSCAISLFKKTFETPQPPTSDTSQPRVELLVLVQACKLWLKYCSYKMLKLAVENRTFPDLSSTMLGLGELAREAGVERPGFSVERWIFWRTRFKELCRSSDETLVSEAKRGYLHMISIGKNLGISIEGETEHHEKVTKYLLEKRQKMGPGAGSVSSEDMPMFSDEE